MIIKLNLKISAAFLASLLFVIFILFRFNTNEINADSTTCDSICLPIIMYHEVKPFKTGKDIITPNELESDLKYLAENNYSTITMTQLVDYVYYNRELPHNPVILSFDDGYLNTYIKAFPLLKKYNMKIVLSLIGKNTDDFTRIPDNNIDYSHVTWDQLNEMLDSGLVEVQNHTYNLHKINKKRYGCMQTSGESFTDYENILRDDIGCLQDKIKQMTGVVPNTFTYPYGKYNDQTDTILKLLGFKATLSCKYGINLVEKDPDSLFGLKRICRSHGYGIKKALADVMKTIK